MIALIEYGSGNVAAIMNILKQKKIAHVLTSDPNEIANADRYILPGVGAFDPTMNHLVQSGIVDVLNEQVLGRKKKVLGICVGMQLLANASDEGSRQGLGWVPGRVRKIDTGSLTQPPRLPHMGWNDIDVQPGASLFDKVDADRGFYFLHSYYFDAAHSEHVAAKVTYGNTLTCAVEKENIFGVQFHPEKSHSNGAQLLQNFAELL